MTVLRECTGPQRRGAWPGWVLGHSGLVVVEPVPGRCCRGGTLVGVPPPAGFAWTRRKNGDVVITHHGREATVLRSARADAFVRDAQDADGPAAQELMARLTGNYKRGNERRAAAVRRDRRG